MDFTLTYFLAVLKGYFVFMQSKMIHQVALLLSISGAHACLAEDVATPMEERWRIASEWKYARTPVIFFDSVKKRLTVLDGQQYAELSTDTGKIVNNPRSMNWGASLLLGRSKNRDLWAVSDDDFIAVINFRGAFKMAPLQFDYDWYPDIASFSANGRYLLVTRTRESSSSVFQCAVIDIEKRRFVSTIDHKDAKAVDFSKDGRHLYSLSANGLVKWNVESGEKTGSWPMPENQPLPARAFVDGAQALGKVYFLESKTCDLFTVVNQEDGVPSVTRTHQKLIDVPRDHSVTNFISSADGAYTIAILERKDVGFELHVTQMDGAGRWVYRDSMSSLYTYGLDFAGKQIAVSVAVLDGITKTKRSELRLISFAGEKAGAE